MLNALNGLYGQNVNYNQPTYNQSTQPAQPTYGIPNADNIQTGKSLADTVGQVGMEGLFHGGPLLSKAKALLTPYYDPYINVGKETLGTLQDQLNALINDPYSIYSKLGQSFQQSPGYNFAYNQAMNAANQAAAAGGMAGTPSNQMYSASLAQGLANQDFYDYIKNMLGLYGQGLSGLGGLTNVGYSAANELAQSLGNTLLTQEKLKYAKDASGNQMGLGLLGTGIGALAGGLLGGPAGAFTGAKIGSSTFSGGGRNSSGSTNFI